MFIFKNRKQLNSSVQYISIFSLSLVNIKEPSYYHYTVVAVWYFFQSLTGNEQ